MVDDYLSRFDKTGRGIGLGPVSVQDMDAKKAGIAGEAALLRKAVAGANPLIVLDERGRTLSSREFADYLATWRDQGRREIAFAVGGADGIDPALLEEADLVLSFGKMVWPHMLARVMLAEQLYRAASILSGSPYHRD